MTYIELKDIDVDGNGTEVSTIIGVNSDNIIMENIDRVKADIVEYKKENPGEWDSDGCFDAAKESFEKQGFEVGFFNPSMTICF